MNQRPLRFAIALGALALAAQARADEWSIEPTAQLSVEYNENPLLVLSPDKQAYGAVADVSAQFAWRSQTAALTALPSLRIAQYPSYSLLNGTDGSVDLAYTKGLENGQFGVSARAIRDRTISSELNTTGIVEANRRRNNYHFAVNGQWRSSERMVLGTELAYEATDFVKDPLGLLVDYRYPSISAYAQRALDERTRLTLTASAGTLRGADIVDKSSNYALRIGLDHTWNERWASTFSIGPSLVAPENGPSFRGMIYSADLTHSGERSRWQLTAQRELLPTGRGILEERQGLSTSFSRSLTEIWMGDLTLRLIRIQEGYRGLFSTDQSRIYGRAEAGLLWRWDSQWTLRMAYIYSQQHYDSLGQDPVGHQVSVAVSWNGWRVARSR